MNPEKLDYIAVLDFGGQYAHLIANRIRRLGVFTQIFSPDSPAELLSGTSGIIFSGGPMSVYDEGAPAFNEDILNIKVPILGICYGHQLIAQRLGGEVSPGAVKEYGIADLNILSDFVPGSNLGCQLFAGFPKVSKAWMSHGDKVSKLPKGFHAVASTDDCEFAAVANEEKKFFGIQFHPEVTHSEFGIKLLDNFISICECEKSWNIKSYLPQISEKILDAVGDRKVFLLVSGGVDSTVAFVLLNRILGHERVLGLHIDNGMMRLNESKTVMDFLTEQGMGNLQIADASDDFLSELEGVCDPEEKRKIIGDTFLWVKDREMLRLSLDIDEWIIAQGTIYPDTIESGGTKNADLIKTHHNRVPAVLELLEKGLLLEPLADLYKDEVRILGLELGIPHNLIWRHPFPGPGLGVRLLCSEGKEISVNVPELQIELDKLSIKGQVLPIKSVGVQGDARTYAQPLLIESDLNWDDLEKHSTSLVNRFKEINRAVWLVGAATNNLKIAPAVQYCTKENFDLLRIFDNICNNFLIENNLYDKIWQMPVVMLPLRVSSYEDAADVAIANAAALKSKPCIVMRPINSSEAMTANFARIPQDLLKNILWPRLRNAGAGALFYDVTHKPPGTIEWE